MMMVGGAVQGTVMNFEHAFKELTGYAPFPWQEALYKRFVDRDIPKTCIIPTGLGKTNAIAVWLIALAQGAKVPRRLVYVVNRRTVVDQTTNEAVKLRKNASKIGVEKLAISTLRGQFEDNREWYADPSCPSIICGTVDMIGSRLLFSGYRIGFKSRPLHAGFLGQDALIVHDEAHLEPAFQKLIEAIEDEQARCKEFKSFHVMELTATTRNGAGNAEKNGKSFELTGEERNPPERIPDPKESEPSIHHVWRRLKARKALQLTSVEDDKKVVGKVAEIASGYKDKNAAVLVFVRTVDAVMDIAQELTKTRRKVVSLTGTMRGKERDELIEKPEFKRFLKDAEPAETVYLVCTSAGEVGIDISADHMVCDLSTFESMAQRFGRVNRYGKGTDTCIDVAHPVSFGKSKKNTKKEEAGEAPDPSRESKEGLDIDELDKRRQKTLELLKKLDGDAGPLKLGSLDAQERQAAFSPPPVILPVTDILFDAWSLTTIREKMPGRPPVAPYLHGLSEWLPPETQIAWREEVGRITNGLLEQYPPKDLLEEYPLKPHETLRNRSERVFKELEKLAARHAEAPIWVVDEDEAIKASTLKEVADKRRKDRINGCTLILPPLVGGLSNGMLDGDSGQADDVADNWQNENGQPRRHRFFSDNPRPEITDATRGMAPICTIDTKPDADESENGDEEGEAVIGRYWHWYARLRDVEDATRASIRPVLLSVHSGDAKREAEKIVAGLELPEDFKKAVILAAEIHDLGKGRELWQRSIGNPNPQEYYAKSGKPENKPRWRSQDLSPYRHEFGSALDSVVDLSHKKRLDEFSEDLRDLILHLVAAHHGRARPHFPLDEVFDPDRPQVEVDALGNETPRRFARLQRKYGRWGLAYLESLVRAADWAASASKGSP
jgi:CRISPR-associated endonuclease/helicase Cas3